MVEQRKGYRKPMRLLRQQAAALRRCRIAIAICLLLLLTIVVGHRLFNIAGVNSLHPFEGKPMRQAIRFDSPNIVTCNLANAPLPERLAAAKELLYRLDALPDVECRGIYEDGRVTVEVVLGGTDRWTVDYHISWPEPQLNNQHLSVIRLVSWTASVVSGTIADPISADNARTMGERQLRGVITKLCDMGEPLHGRISLY